MKITLKIHLQQNQVTIFHQVFQYLTISSFRSMEDKHDKYRGKDFMKKFCEFLREHAMKIINFRKKKNEVINKRAAGII